MKQKRKKIGRLSKELSASSLVAAISMDSTVGDGLSSDSLPLVTIVISTPRGEVVSQALPSTAVDEIRELLESGIARIDRLSVDTPDGLVIVPGDLLRQSLIQFVKGHNSAKAAVASGKRRTTRAVPNTDSSP